MRTPPPPVIKNKEAFIFRLLEPRRKHERKKILIQSISMIFHTAASSQTTLPPISTPPECPATILAYSSSFSLAATPTSSSVSGSGTTTWTVGSTNPNAGTTLTGPSTRTSGTELPASTPNSAAGMGVKSLLEMEGLVWLGLRAVLGV